MRKGREKKAGGGQEKMGMLTELLFLLEEGAVEGIGGGVVEELKAVEDLDGPAPLHADDAAEDTRGRRRGGGGWCAVVANVSGGGGRGVLGPGFDAGVVVGDVYDDEGMEFECQPTAAAAAAGIARR